MPDSGNDPWIWQDSLYDHYKDSFQQIRGRESRRDNEFLIVIGLLLALAVAIAYSMAITRAIASATIAGVKLDLSLVPVPAILSALWVVTLTMTVRYCQDCINIERQYTYLHSIEDKLSRHVGDDEMFRREGKAYLADYPYFSEWVWIAYIYVFPTVVLVSTVLLSIYEWVTLESSMLFKLADSTLAVCICISLFLYRLLQPILASKEARSQPA